MTEDLQELLEEARESISAASLLLGGGYPGYAVSRGYYARFYTAEAFLEAQGMSFSKHSAVIPAFGQYFAQTGKIPPEFHRFLLEAFELRHKGDYGLRHAINYEQAQEQIARPEEFLRLAERHFGEFPPDSRGKS